MKTPPARIVLFALLTTLIVSLTPGVARAAVPSNTAQSGVSMVDGPVVNDIVIVGNQTWIGGRFSDVENQNGSTIASASGLTVFDAGGSLVNGVHGNLPNLNGANPTVYDLSLGPNGILYAAGKFTYSKGGGSYKNLVGIDPSNGSIAATFKAPNLKAVLATAAFVYGGGKKLSRFSLAGGNAGGGFHSLVTHIDSSLRGHKTAAAIREIEAISATTLLVVGAFDSIDGTGSANEKKVAVKVNALTGQPDLGSGSWEINCQCARQESAAFGLASEIAGNVVYIASGGNDWVGAFNLSNGDRIWQTDTNGSAQELTVYDGSTLIVGGHWTYIEDDGPNDQDGAECPSRNASKPDPCWEQPRLAALDRGNGMPDKSWTPNVCCKYRGIWATTVDGSMLHVGGEFTKLDGEPGPEHFYGRFT